MSNALRGAEEAAHSPRRGDVWESPNRLLRIQVTNGMWRGLVTYTRRFAGDPPKHYTCPPSKWGARVQGLVYRGRE